MSPASARPLPTIHASSVVIGTIGVLIRGASGSGKSALSDLLIETAALKGHFSALVSDDRTSLQAESGNLVAAPARALAGKMEVRGVGIVNASHEGSVVIRLVADLKPAGEVERLPQEAKSWVELEGVLLPLVQLHEGCLAENLRCLRWAIRKLFPGRPDYI